MTMKLARQSAPRAASGKPWKFTVTTRPAPVPAGTSSWMAYAPCIGAISNGTRHQLGSSGRCTRSVNCQRAVAALSSGGPNLASVVWMSAWCA